MRQLWRDDALGDLPPAVRPLRPHRAVLRGLSPGLSAQLLLDLAALSATRLNTRATGQTPGHRLHRPRTGSTHDHHLDLPPCCDRLGSSSERLDSRWAGIVRLRREYVAQSQAGTIEAPGGMVIGSDVSPDEWSRGSRRARSARAPRRTRVESASCSATTSRHLAVHRPGQVTSSLDRAARHAAHWPSRLQVGALPRQLLTGGPRRPTANDVVLGQAIVRPSETSENVCNTTPFANAAGRELRGALHRQRHRGS